MHLRVNSKWNFVSGKKKKKAWSQNQGPRSRVGVAAAEISPPLHSSNSRFTLLRTQVKNTSLKGQHYHTQTTANNMRPKVKNLSTLARGVRAPTWSKWTDLSAAAYAQTHLWDVAPYTKCNLPLSCKRNKTFFKRNVSMNSKQATNT